MSRGGAKLGQHFLIHSWAARALAHAVPLNEGETYLEIGPGKGILTRELLALGPVVAVEKDPELIPKLQDTFSAEIISGKLRLVEDDVRNISAESLGLGAYIVAANIPYYITGEIIRQFLTAASQPLALALLVQKEVAQRVVSKKESLLSLSVKAYGVPHIAEKVSRKHFSPPPKVDSAILVIEKVSKDFFSDITEENFFKVAHAGFASKRKMVANNLAVVFGKEKALAALALAGVSEKARAEDIDIEKWKVVTRGLVG
ncbi:MAG: ribosomal RNA small subunit methyltransferase A [Candidatus Pacebacteria bacterium]|nr:ribosomal RNA small subunit methyltransferase A [Candidatus Paceibacterota bacterium]